MATASTVDAVLVLLDELERILHEVRHTAQGLIDSNDDNPREERP